MSSGRGKQSMRGVGVRIGSMRINDNQRSLFYKGIIGGKEKQLIQTRYRGRENMEQLRFAPLIRVSTERQDKQGESLTTQKKATFHNFFLYFLKKQFIIV